MFLRARSLRRGLLEPESRVPALRARVPVDRREGFPVAQADDRTRAVEGPVVAEHPLQDQDHGTAADLELDLVLTSRGAIDLHDAAFHTGVVLHHPGGDVPLVASTLAARMRTRDHRSHGEGSGVTRE